MTPHNIGELKRQIANMVSDTALIFILDGKRLRLQELIYTPKMPTGDPYDDCVSALEVWLERPEVEKLCKTHSY